MFKYNHEYPTLKTAEWDYLKNISSEFTSPRGIRTVVTWLLMLVQDEVHNKTTPMTHAQEEQVRYGITLETFPPSASDRSP